MAERFDIAGYWSKKMKKHTMILSFFMAMLFALLAGLFLYFRQPFQAR